MRTSIVVGGLLIAQAAALTALAGPSAAAAAAGAAPCGKTAIKVETAAGTAAATHASSVIVLHNVSARPCSLTGYPGLDALDSTGRVLAHAQRTLSGYLGGAHYVQTITVYPDQRASALVEWTTVDSHGNTCTRAASVATTPPHTTATVRTAKVRPYTCGLQIHPVVGGASGQG